MAIAITLLFDEDLEKVLTAATATAHEMFGGMDLGLRGIRPHVTLGIFDTIDLDAALPVLEGLMACSPLATKLPSVGTFGGPAGVVFLAPVVTPRLLELHARVHTALAPHAEKAWPHYVPRAWVPHVTLAHDVPLNRVGAAIGWARELPLPLSGTAQALWVLETDDVDVATPVVTHAIIPLAAPRR